MLSNYFKIATRKLWRNKSFSAINIAGLSIGIATCLTILLYVQHELSYDRFNEKADRIVRVIFKGNVQGEKLNEANVMPPVAQTLKADYPEVQDATRLRAFGRPRVSVGDQIFKDEDFAYADPNFFQFFTLPLAQGNAGNILTEPNTVVLSRTVAHKYFGQQDPVGKTIHFKDEGLTFKVTGIMEDMPVNAHFHFDMLGSMAGLPESRNDSWMTSNFFTYLVLQEGYDYRQLQAKLPQVVDKYMGPQLLQGIGVSLADFRKKGNDIGLYLQPLTDIHLHSDFAADLSAAGDIRYVYLFSAIAMFMLLIACINFMNLSTAGASKRSKEVGIRKVLGSVKMELVRQFLVESILLTAVSLGLAVGLVYMTLPYFNDLTGIDLHFSFYKNVWLFPALVSFGLFTGLLAGSYPAFVLSGFSPLAVLKNRFTAGKKTFGLRSGLVVFQFCISIILIIGTAVVYRQLAYIQNKKLGYDKEQVLVLPETWLLGKNEPVFRQQIQQDPRVVDVSTSGYLPAGRSKNNNFFVYAEEKAAQVKTLRYDVDYHYIPTLGLQMVAGRNFSTEFGADSSGIIINETASKAFGWGNNPLGHTISHSDNDGSHSTYQVIGLVRDFHFRSLHERISPLVMVLGHETGQIVVKVKTTDFQGIIASLKNTWNTLVPGEPFEYAFLDDRVNKTYEAEQKTGLILAIFAGLTIFVACLGLFGLAMFTAEQRIKEIGVRKVLGASVLSVTGLLAKDFLKLVVVALVIASPVSWYLMQGWLADFAYHTDMQWWIFAGTGLLAIVIASLTIGFQSIKAALANPVKSLRSE